MENDRKKKNNQKIKTRRKGGERGGGEEYDHKKSKCSKDPYSPNLLYSHLLWVINHRQCLDYFIPLYNTMTAQILDFS